MRRRDPAETDWGEAWRLAVRVARVLLQCGKPRDEAIAIMREITSAWRFSLTPEGAARCIDAAAETMKAAG